jgi:hypothetical protein
VRLVLSVGIALHFFAIFTTLVGSGSGRFPAPALAAWMRHTKPIDAYLQATFLTSPYRFYAPDPGPSTLMWFKLRYADGAVRWMELARRDELPSRTSYQRHMSLPLLLDWMGLYPDPDDSRRVMFTEEGKVCVSSFVRHVARSNPRLSADGASMGVSDVTVYMVYHQILQPYQIRMNWQFDDLRLYSQRYLGVYSARGVRSEDPYGGAGYVIPFNSYLLAEFLLEDAEPLLRDVPARARIERVASLHLPAPWERVLARYPEALGELPPPEPDEDPNAKRARVERLQRYLEEKVMSQDKRPAR